MIIQVELDSPIMYIGATGEVEGSFIEIKEPTGKVAHLAGIMKAELGMATKKAFSDLDIESVDIEADSAAPTKEQEGEALYSVINTGGADIKKILLALKELLRETALIAGEKKITEPMFDRLAYRDVEKILKAYLANFIA